MKYSGHESFSIRKDWLQKGLRKIECFQKSEVEAMDDLGIGRNMVKSLRYWLKATSLTIDDSKKKTFELSDFGKIIAKNDPYIQENGTLFFLHYKLATNKDFATSWHFFFNFFGMTEFSAEDFLRAIQKWDEMNNPKPVSLSSLQKDFECIRHTYLHSDSENEEPESNMTCPFSELGLLKEENGVFRKSAPSKKKIHPLVLYASLCEQAKNLNQSEIKLSLLQNGENCAGKIFNLDSILIMSLLSELENKNYLDVVRSGGLDVVRLKKNLNFNECVKEYFKELGNE